MQEKKNIYTNVNPLQTDGLKKLEMENDEAEDLSGGVVNAVYCAANSAESTYW